LYPSFSRTGLSVDDVYVDLLTSRIPIEIVTTYAKPSAGTSASIAFRASRYRYIQTLIGLSCLTHLESVARRLEDKLVEVLRSSSRQALTSLRAVIISGYIVPGEVRLVFVRLSSHCSSASKFKVVGGRRHSDREWLCWRRSRLLLSSSSIWRPVWKLLVRAEAPYCSSQ
jgi:hypothetical protein